MTADLRNSDASRVASLLAIGALALACTSRHAREDARGDPTSVTAITDRAESSGETGAASDASSESSATNAMARSATTSIPLLPRFASGSLPEYPRASRRLGEQGWVEVAIDVRQDGEVVLVAIAASSGSPRLDEAVLTAAHTWRFLPRTGERGVDRLLHRVVFQLTEK